MKVSFDPSSEKETAEALSFILKGAYVQICRLDVSPRMEVSIDVFNADTNDVSAKILIRLYSHTSGKIIAVTDLMQEDGH